MRISKAKWWSTIVWLLRSCKRKGKSFKSYITTQCIPTMSQCMKNPKRTSILRKINISRPTNSWRSTLILKMITIQRIQHSKNCLTASPKRESLRLFWRRERCIWKSSKRSIKSKRESLKPWTGQKKRPKKIFLQVRPTRKKKESVWLQKTSNNLKKNWTKRRESSERLQQWSSAALACSILFTAALASKSSQS